MVGAGKGEGPVVNTLRKEPVSSTNAKTLKLGLSGWARVQQGETGGGEEESTRGGGNSRNRDTKGEEYRVFSEHWAILFGGSTGSMRWGTNMKRMSGLKGGAFDHGAETLVTGDRELV